MTVSELNKEYISLKESNNIAGKIKFNTLLSELADKNMLDYHFSLITDKQDLWFSQILRDSFIRRKNIDKITTMIIPK